MKTNTLTRRHSRTYSYVALAVGGLIISLTAITQAQTVTNGGFESTTNGSSSRQVANFDQSGCATPSTGASARPCGIGGSTMPAAGSTSCKNSGTSITCIPYAFVNGWNAKGLVLMFRPDGTINATDPHGAAFQYAGGVSGTPGPTTFQLWSTHNGGADVVPDACNLTGCGGNFLALDGDAGSSGRFQGSISQSLSGLNTKDAYKVTFFWAAGQQFDKSGPTMEQIRVSLCGGNQSPGTNSIANSPVGASGPCSFYTEKLSTNPHSFHDWREATAIFPASDFTSRTLSFLALGSPTGEPPFTLLDGVSIAPVSTPVIPEPGTWSLLGTGLAALARAAYRRAKSVSVSA